MPDTQKSPLLIIGNGMVSWRLCQQLVELGVHKQRSITVCGEEARPAYDRVNLTRAFELENNHELELAPSDWYRDHGIALHTESRIVSLDRDARTAGDQHGKNFGYDDCVLATGSRPFLPPIPGSDQKQVYVYRTLDDIARIKTTAQNSKRALVIGGGLLGLEAADALRKLGLETCIVQNANALMSRQLNEDSSAYLLREVARLGMSVRLSAITERIESHGEALRVSFKQGDPLDVDLVVIAAGITPRDELARASGLPVGTRGGVLVNDHLQSEDPHLFAIGECACHHGIVYGLVAPGYQMADCLARQLAGKPKSTYGGSDQSCRLKLLGIEVSVFGQYLEPGTEHIFRGQDSYRSLIVRKNAVIGATVIGPWKQTMRVERAIADGRRFRLREFETFMQSGDLFAAREERGVLSWPDEALLCHCTSTTCGQLRKAIQAGCRNVDELSEKTGAGTVCGSCRPNLADFTGEDDRAKAILQAPKGQKLLIFAAGVGLLLSLIFFGTPGLPAATSVQNAYYQLTQLWQDSLTKQITGFSLAGLSVLAILISARKRLKRFSFGNYGFWRAVHSWLGITTLLVLFLHTGFHFGENLNLWLILCFLGLNLAGALTAIAVASEARLRGRWGSRFRFLATRSHIVFFLPYPVLLGFHIAKVYVY